MFKILITDKVLPEVLAYAKKKKDIKIDYNPGLETDELLKIIGEYDGLIVRSRTKVTKQVLEKGKRLKVVGRAGVGLDTIDKKFAKRNGIEVLNTPDATSNTVAEHTIGLLLALSRKIAQADASLKAGRWDKKLFMGYEIEGKTLGIIGYGRIGSKVARKASALGMKVIVFDKRKKMLNTNSFEIFTNLSKFLSLVDYLSIHVPLNDNTRNMITRKELAKLKDTCFVLNCSRGGIVNETDLITTLKNGRIAGAAIDVFTKEPQFNKRLVKFPNVVATPHIAASTKEAQMRCGVEIIDKVADIFSARTQARQVRHLPHLEIVPIEDIILHEYFDKKRVGPLAKKIKSEGDFSNPSLVTKIKRGKKTKYLILDGSNRIESLKKLGMPHALVQIVDYNNSKVLLKKWNHGMSGISSASFIKKARTIPGFIKKMTTPEQARDKVQNGAWLCAIIIGSERAYGVKGAKTLQKKLRALNKIVSIYSGKVKIRRFEGDDINVWSDRYDPKQIAIIFPTFTKRELMSAAEKGILFPSGITRHLIEQRVLGVNIPISFLKSNKPLEEKNKWLRDFIDKRMRESGGLRYYEESIFVFD